MRLKLYAFLLYKTGRCVRTKYCGFYTNKFRICPELALLYSENRFNTIWWPLQTKYMHAKMNSVHWTQRKRMVSLNLCHLRHIGTATCIWNAVVFYFWNFPHKSKSTGMDGIKIQSKHLQSFSKFTNEKALFFLFSNKTVFIETAVIPPKFSNFDFPSLIFFLIELTWAAPFLLVKSQQYSCSLIPEVLKLV